MLYAVLFHSARPYIHPFARQNSFKQPIRPCVSARPPTSPSPEPLSSSIIYTREDRYRFRRVDVVFMIISMQAEWLYNTDTDTDTD